MLEECPYTARADYLARIIVVREREYAKQRDALEARVRALEAQVTLLTRMQALPSPFGGPPLFTPAAATTAPTTGSAAMILSGSGPTVASGSAAAAPSATFTSTSAAGISSFPSRAK